MYYSYLSYNSIVSWCMIYHRGIDPSYVWVCQLCHYLWPGGQSPMTFDGKHFWGPFRADTEKKKIATHLTRPNNFDWMCKLCSYHAILENVLLRNFSMPSVFFSIFFLTPPHIWLCPTPTTNNGWFLMWWATLASMLRWIWPNLEFWYKNRTLGSDLTKGGLSMGKVVEVDLERIAKVHNPF